MSDFNGGSDWNDKGEHDAFDDYMDYELYEKNLIIMMYIIQAGIELLETELITIIRKLRSIMNFKIADLGKAVFENQVIIDADD